MANEDTCPGCDAFWTATLINVVIGMYDVTISPCFVICMFKKPEQRAQLFSNPTSWNMDDFLNAESKSVGNQESLLEKAEQAL